MGGAAGSPAVSAGGRPGGVATVSIGRAAVRRASTTANLTSTAACRRRSNSLCLSY